MAADSEKLPAASAEEPRAIPEVLAAHFEELASLWAIRQEHIRGPDWTLPDLNAWDERLTPHLEGLVAAGTQPLPLLDEHLASDDSAAVFAAALVLLRMQDAVAADRLMAAVSEAQGPKLIALSDALSAAPIVSIEPRLREISTSGPLSQAMVATLALAAHARLDPKVAVRQDAFQSEDASVRLLAWRCIALRS